MSRFIAISTTLMMSLMPAAPGNREYAGMKTRCCKNLTASLAVLALHALRNLARRARERKSRQPVRDKDNDYDIR